MRRQIAKSCRRPAALLGIIVGVVLLSGCSEAPASPVPTDRPEMPARVFAQDSTWTVHLTIGGEADDSTLLIPTHPAANERGIYLTDLGADRVVHFNRLGELVWSVGRTGEGPGEFMAPRDLGLSSDGSIWVADQGTGRVTILSPEGAIERFVNPAVEGSLNEIVPLRDSSAIVTLLGPTRPFARIDRDGNVLETTVFPWKGFAELSTLSNQFLTASDAETEDWVAAFRVGDGFFPFHRGVTGDYRGWFVEEVAFPIPTVSREGNVTTTRFLKQPVAAAVSVTLSPTSIYVLFGGESDYRGRVLDRYARSDGTYVESILLPEPAMDITWFDGGLYVLRQTPYPEIAYMTRGSRLP